MQDCDKERIRIEKDKENPRNEKKGARIFFPSRHLMHKYERRNMTFFLYHVFVYLMPQAFQKDKENIQVHFRRPPFHVHEYKAPHRS